MTPAALAPAALAPFMLVIALTLMSGLGDALGFVHAGRIWQGERFIAGEAVKSGLGFLFGLLMYWLALRPLQQFGVVSAEVQTLLWFGVTLVGVALLSGRFAHWPPLDKAVAAGVLAGLMRLLVRTEA